VVSVVMWVTVVVCILALSGWVFANCSPKLVSLGQVVWWGVHPPLGLYKNLLFLSMHRNTVLFMFSQIK
jgi:hypothetical protein